MIDWQPIETAPQDIPIVVYAVGQEGLPDLASLCKWHPDAGFCIDEIREPKYWCLPPVWTQEELDVAEAKAEELHAKLNWK